MGKKAFSDFLSKGSLRLLLAALLLVSLLAFLAERGTVEMPLGRAATALAASFPVVILSIFTLGCRLSVLTGPPVRPSQGMKVYIIAQLVALIVPSRLSEAAKPIGLNLLCGLPLPRGVAVLAVERVIDTVMVAVMMLATAILVAGPFAEKLAASGVVMLMLAVAGIGMAGLLALKPGLIRRAADGLPFGSFRRHADQIGDQLVALADPRKAAAALILSGLSWLSSYLVFFVFFSVALSSPPSPGEVLAIFVVSTLGLVISVAPGGLGTFEAAVALSLEAFGTPASTGLAVAVILRLAHVLPVAVLATGYFLSGSLRLSDIFAGLKKADEK
jgi:uncharacterized membrane protein YbhN (UPF0104 family)